MQKKLATLGLSFLLVGCFEAQKEKEMSSTSVPEQRLKTDEKQAPKALAHVDVKKTVELEKTSEQQDATTTTATITTTASTVSAESGMMKIVQLVSARQATGERISAESLLASSSNNTTIPVKSVQQSQKEKSTTVKKLEAQKRKASGQSVAGTYENGQLVSNFSLEELRLGAQAPITMDEINRQRMQCRYPFMSTEEMTANDCQPKIATVTY